MLAQNLLLHLQLLPQKVIPPLPLPHCAAALLPAAEPAARQSAELMIGSISDVHQVSPKSEKHINIIKSMIVFAILLPI